MAAILSNHPDVAHVARVQGQIQVLDFFMSKEEGGFRAKLTEHLSPKDKDEDD